MRDVYSDSTPCVVTVQKNASRYKQRVQSTEREIAALSLRDPLSLLAYAQNFRPFLSLENPPTPHRLSPPPALPDRPSLSFFFSSRCFAQGQGQKLVRKGVAPPPVRFRAVILYCGDDDEHGKRPGLLSAAIRSSSWDMRATLRNRVGDPRAQAIFVQQQGDGCIYLSDLPSQNKATRTYKRKEERSSGLYVYGECKSRSKVV